MIRDAGAIYQEVEVCLNEASGRAVRWPDPVNWRKKEAARLKRRPVLALLDEFPQLGRMDVLEHGIAVCAGYGVRMAMVCQDEDQIRSAYGANQSITANCVSERQIREIEASQAAALKSAQEQNASSREEGRGVSAPDRTALLLRLRGLGHIGASVLSREVFYRRFDNRREVASYFGLAPSPYNSGSMSNGPGKR